MNIELKVALLKRFGSQIRASRPLKIEEGRLSKLVQGHREPNAREREALKRFLGADYFAVELHGETHNDGGGESNEQEDNPRAIAS